MVVYWIKRYLWLLFAMGLITLPFVNLDSFPRAITINHQPLLMIFEEIPVQYGLCTWNNICTWSTGVAAAIKIVSFMLGSFLLLGLIYDGRRARQ